jgi:starvation-inducible DNA-binding protein
LVVITTRMVSAMTTPFITDIPDHARAAMCVLLNARLADALDLKLALKQAHWNVRGIGFIAVHELLDQVAGRFDGHADLIAERAVQLGALAVGTLQAVAKATSLPAYPADVTAIDVHILAVRERLSAFTASCRSAIHAATVANDANTADIFTEVSRAVDKDLWFVAANLG